MIFRVLMHKLCFLQGLLGSLLFTHTLSPSHLHFCSFLSYCWIILPSWDLMSVCLFLWLRRRLKGGGVVVQSLSCVRLFETPWTAAHQVSLSFTISWSLLKLLSIKSVMPSNHLVLCYSLLLLPSVLPSIRILSSESALCVRWPKYWGFNFNISTSNEYSGLISFRMDWLDLLAVQGTLKSLLQHHSSKASVLWCSAFLILQLSQLYMTSGKNIALTRQTFEAK